ncbi:MAG: gliding motility-associated-like protein [Limisphaerales bacterium]|jgi:gliding motility-associated-like protein
MAHSPTLSIVQFLQTALLLIFICPSQVLGHDAHDNTSAQDGDRLFVQNLGQWDDPFHFRLEQAEAVLFAETSGFSISMLHGGDLNAIIDLKEKSINAPPGGFSVRGHAIKVSFRGAQEVVPVSASEPANYHHNYFLGADQERWAGNVSLYTKVRYDNLYPGIDLEMYTGATSLKYDFIVKPGSNPRAIGMKYDGQNKLSLRNNNLIVSTSIGEYMEAAPYAYQIIKGKEVAVECEFIIEGNLVRFNIGRYNTRVPLIIDPVLIFSTFTGSSSDNWGYSATYDEDGHLYGGGIVFGASYPVTPGAFQEIFGSGSCDIGITKYTPDGTALVWSTYIGGADNELPHSLIVNDNNELFIYGTTGSSDFPVTTGAYDGSFNGGGSTFVTGIPFYSGIDIFVARLSADGSTMLGCTFIGGNDIDGLNIAAQLHYNYGDHARGEIILDAIGNPIVASSTYSTDFPTTAGALSATLNGGQDGIIFQFDPLLTTLNWSTYYGGSLDDGAYSIKVDAGDLIVCGGTRSFDFPVSATALNTTYNGGAADGWVSRLNGDATSVIASTYIGTGSYDQTYFVDKDDDSEVYIMGQTLGSAYPVSPGTFSVPFTTQYITKLNPNLSSIIYSSRFGSGTSEVNISPTAFLVDICENVYVSGWGGIVNSGFNPATGSTSGMPLTVDAFQDMTDGSDFYFYALSKNGLSHLYGSYFGGGSSGGAIVREHVDGGTSRFDKTGIVYQAVCAGCGGSSDFPTTSDAWSTTNGASNCNLGTIKFEFDLSGVFAVSDAFPAIFGCVPFSVDFENNSSGAAQYLWDFGDGDTSTLFEPTHVYDSLGIFNVLLIAIDSNSCNIADSSYLTIITGIDSITANFDIVETQNCDTLWADFTDLSTTLGPSTVYSFATGDGTILDTVPASWQYVNPGFYQIILILTDSTSCNFSDTLIFDLDYQSDFESGFIPTVSGCVPVTVDFGNDYPLAESYEWDFGDGNTATGLDPVNIYTVPGIYTITLVTTNCGVSDTTLGTVVVPEDPIAFFDDEPYAAIINTPVSFTNLSQFSSIYLWDFGDGTTSSLINPSHSFSGENTFTVCLTAFNDFGCEDTYCRTIDIEFDGIVDVPNAFTPNGDGVNDQFYLGGFGMESVKFRIFNRWGELVFETNNPGQGWDGTFRGIAQEIDVYIYTVEAFFANGRKEELKGNVSLIR